MEIVWKSIAGYDGLYEVSSDGRVRTIGHMTRGHAIPSRELVIRIHKSQRYARVRLYKDGKPKDLAVHRLVAEAFIPNPENKPQVNHIDGNRSNNKVENLEWCTAAENQIHAFKTGLKDIEDTVVYTRKRVLQKDMNGELIKIWRSMSDAARELGLHVSNISHCCNGRINSTGGYRWEYDLGN